MQEEENHNTMGESQSNSKELDAATIQNMVAQQGKKLYEEADLSSANARLAAVYTLNLEIERREDLLRKIIEDAACCSDLEKRQTAILYCYPDQNYAAVQVDAAKLAKFCLNHEAVFYEVIGRRHPDEFWEYLAEEFSLPVVDNYSFSKQEL